MGNSQSHSNDTQAYDYDNPPPDAPNPWENLQHQQKNRTSSSKSSSPASSTTSGKSTGSQRKAERRIQRLQQREERALARAERRRTKGNCGGCGEKKKPKMLTDMYFESLNSSLGDRKLQEPTTPTVSHERLRQLRNNEDGKRGDQIGDASLRGGGQTAAAGLERGTEEVPPPAYDEVMEQTQPKKA